MQKLKVFKTRASLLLVCLLLAAQLFAQPAQQVVSIGDFTTTGGAVIKNCQQGYRTLGTLNAQKSNVILWPTWFTGTSRGIVNIVPKIVDTTQYYIVIADALGNGVSSAPSNTKNFPAITIRDMVTAQHTLLTSILNIQHVYAVGGISMGAMQALEWAVAYPAFMDKAISIVGTPKQSFHDLLLWNTELNTINDAANSGNKQAIADAMQKVNDIHLMELYTPAYFVRTIPADSFAVYLNRMHAKPGFDIADWRIQLQAMLQHDIYKSSGKGIAEINQVIKAKLLIIAAVRDQMVNPQSVIDLAKQLGSRLELFDNDCGHNLFECGTDRAKRVIGSFLKE